MKLGIIGDWSEEGFKYVKSKGLDCVEFCYNHDQPTDKLLALVPSHIEWQAKYGVKILSIILIKCLLSEKRILESLSLPPCSTKIV
ncbi:MAG: hypothetical protein IJ050_03410 [Clostridia bacterium]|nr:hypothetical protein [Clostridia bacterium]